MIEYRKVDGSFDLSGKSAIVVGGAGGIGGATAEMYAKKGANIAIADCKDNVKEAAARLAETYGVKTIGLKCDVTKQSDIDQTVAAVTEAFGEINILANMPGYVELESAECIGVDVIEKHLAINAVGVFRMSQAVANQMIKQGKHVGYTMSKAALVGMIKVCALEWAEFGINVNGVAPTVVNTYMGEKAWQGQVKIDMINAIPAHRFAETDEIAAAVLFLSCDESNMITGEDLVVDGGFTIK